VTTHLTGMRPLLVAALMLAAAPAAAHEARAGAITVVHPIVRASIGKTPTTAAYMTLRNAGTTPDRLLSVRCACAETVTAHTMSMADGRMVMRPAGPVTVPAGGEVSLKPGGAHLMLTGLYKPLEAGTLVELTMVFERAGALKVPTFATARIDQEMTAHGGGHKH
jgi:hypothetical protein